MHHHCQTSRPEAPKPEEVLPEKGMEDNLDTGPELTPHLPPVPDPSTLQLQGSPVQATNQCFLHLLLGL